MQTTGANTMCGVGAELRRDRVAMMLPHDGSRVVHADAEEAQPALGDDHDRRSPSSAIENIAGSTLGSTSRTMIRRLLRALRARREHELALRPRAARSRA